MTFHQDLRQDRTSEKESQYLEIKTCDPSIYRMDYPDFNVCSFTENSIGLKMVKVFESSVQCSLNSELQFVYSHYTCILSIRYVQVGLVITCWYVSTLSRLEYI